MLYEHTVTLFNRYKSKVTGDMWYPTVLRNVHINVDKSAIIAKYGAESQDNAVLNVHYQTVEGVKTISGKPWKPPKEWAAQTNDLLPGSLTFADGNDFDFFWWGEWPDEKPISDDAYGIDGFYDYMNRRNDYVFAITSVGGPYTVLPTFVIMGK